MRYEKRLIVTQADLKQRTWRVMTPQDLNGFAGVESPVPLISECANFLAVLDGLHLEVYATVEESGDFELVFETDDVRELAWKHDAPFNAEFRGAARPRAGEDY